MKTNILAEYAFLLLSEAEKAYLDKNYGRTLACLNAFSQYAKRSLEPKNNTSEQVALSITLIKQAISSYRKNESFICLNRCLQLISNQLLSSDFVTPWINKAITQVENKIATIQEKLTIQNAHAQYQGFFKLANLALSEKENNYNSGERRLDLNLLLCEANDIAIELEAKIAERINVTRHAAPDNAALAMKKISTNQRRLAHCRNLALKTKELLSSERPHISDSPSTISAALSPGMLSKKTDNILNTQDAPRLGKNNIGFIQNSALLQAQSAKEKKPISP